MQKISEKIPIPSKGYQHKLNHELQAEFLGPFASEKRTYMNIWSAKLNSTCKIDSWDKEGGREKKPFKVDRNGGEYEESGKGGVDNNGKRAKAKRHKIT